MESAKNGVNLAREPDFVLGPLTVSPSTCRLLVGDQEHRTEAKSMAVLVTLARASGGTVTRDDLIDACWEGRIVSDDAIARAIAKVRSLAKCTEPEAFTLETVPKVGYRLVAQGGEMQTSAASQPSAPEAALPVAEVTPLKVGPVDRFAPVQTPAPSPPVVVESTAVAIPQARSGALSTYTPHLAAFAAVGVLAILATYLMTPSPPVAPPIVRATAWQDARSAGVSDALLKLDFVRMRAYLAGGWHPDFSLDEHRGTALQSLMMVCERNRGHDQEALVEMAKLLVASGADPSAENQFGDQAYSIARCVKYCGPDHPVVAYLKSITPHPKIMPCKPPGT